MTMAQASTLCCEAISPTTCSVESHYHASVMSTKPAHLDLIDSSTSDQSQISVSGPEALVYCERSSDMMLATGFECGDYAALNAINIFHPFGLNSVILSTCAAFNGSITNPARTTFQCCNILESPAPLTTNYCPALPNRPVSAPSIVTSSDVQNPLSYGSTYSLTCAESASGGFHLSGNNTTVCQIDGNWSNNGQLGECLALDAFDCVNVQSSGLEGSITTVLSCPAVNDDSTSWVVVASAGLCQSSLGQDTPRLSILHDMPVSVSTWQSTCFDQVTQSTQPAALMKR